MKDGKTIVSLFLPAAAVATLFATAWGLAGPETAFWATGGMLLGALVPGGWILARRRTETECRAVLERWLQGDVSARVPVGDGPAPGVAGRINGVGDLLQERQQEISGLASALEQLAGRLSGHAETIAQGGSVDEIAETVNGAMEELAQAMEGVARSATAAAEASHQADSSADSGKLSMTEAIGAMEATTSEMRRAKAALQELASDSESIGTVLDVIRGIAEQTNMLALNAAIEAARAGEQGRGFAVVADEVRTLASRTQQSTEEINRMIERLQSAARNVGSVVDEGVQQAQACEELIETACISFAEIAGEVATIDQMGSEIRQATELQGTRVQAIRQTVADGLAGTAHQEATDRALEFATELYGLAERLAART